MTDLSLTAEDRRLLAEHATDMLGENSLERWEAVADEFYRATGYLRPGKSYPMEMPCFDEEARNLAWNSWVKARSARIGMVLRQVLEALDQPSPTVR